MPDELRYGMLGLLSDKSIRFIHETKRTQSINRVDVVSYIEMMIHTVKCLESHQDLLTNPFVHHVYTGNIQLLTLWFDMEWEDIKENL